MSYFLSYNLQLISQIHIKRPFSFEMAFFFLRECVIFINCLLNAKRLNMATSILVIAVVGGGIYFAYWAVQKTLKEDVGRNRREKRRFKRR